jgi:hypothetical protein
MAHVNGIAGAGNAEALRLQQTVVHRGAEFAALIEAGRREDRLRAERIPEAESGRQVGDGEAGGGGREGAAHDGGRRGAPSGPQAGAPGDGHGGLIDLQA